MNTILFSIIVPHKDSPILLDRCLSSIPQRDDLEIIVIDDCSNDRPRVISVCSKYKRVSLFIDESNLGAGHCRNVGVAKAVGKWLLFSDADDFFHIGFIETCHKYVESDYDLIFFDADCCYSHNLEPAPRRINAIGKGIGKLDIEVLKWQVMPVWSKMFRTSLITDNNIKFDEVKASNDVMFTYQVSHYANKCAIDTFVLYCNTINYNSLCYKISESNIDSRVNVRARANKYLCAIGKAKYRGNLFSLYLYYLNFGTIAFLKVLPKYIKNSTFSSFLNDMKMSFFSCIKIISHKGNNGRKHQTIQ